MPVWLAEICRTRACRSRLYNNLVFVSKGFLEPHCSHFSCQAPVLFLPVLVHAVTRLFPQKTLFMPMPLSHFHLHLSRLFCAVYATLVASGIARIRAACGSQSFHRQPSVWFTARQMHSFIASAQFIA